MVAKWLYILALGLLTGAVGYLVVAVNQELPNRSESACEAALKSPEIVKLMESVND